MDNQIIEIGKTVANNNGNSYIIIDINWEGDKLLLLRANTKKLEYVVAYGIKSLQENHSWDRGEYYTFLDLAMSSWTEVKNEVVGKISCYTYDDEIAQGVDILVNGDITYQLDVTEDGEVRLIKHLNDDESEFVYSDRL